MTQNNGANKIRVDTSEDRTFDKAENGRTRAKRLEDWKKEVEAETAHYLAGVQRVEDLEGWVYTEASIQQLTYLDESALAMILSGLGERFGSDFDRTKMIQLLKAARPAKQQQQESAGNISHFPTKTREGAPSDAEIEAEAGAYRTDAGKMPQRPQGKNLLKFAADDNGNAEAMHALYGHEFLYAPAYGWLKWNGTYWRHTSEQTVTQYTIAALKQRRHAAVSAGKEAIVKVTVGSRDRVSGCMSLFKSYVIEESVDVFDADPDLLNCQNGVLNLRTGDLTPHDPSQRFTYCVPADYDPAADTSAWSNWLLDTFERDEEKARYFQECAGYSLTGHTRDEKMFYLYGPSRAGKGTVTETMLALLPSPLSDEVDFNSFTAKRDNDNQNFDLAELKPARIVFASESTRYQSLNPAKIKQITGGNRVRCAFKHKDMFSYQPQFKVWLVSNHKVKADADDEALWGRVQVFDFPHSHLGKEDVTLKESMKSPENRSGVLRWAVEGAMRWYTAGHLTPPAAVIQDTRKHRAEQDYIAQWLGDCCTLGGDTWTASSALQDSYKAWCDTTGTKPLAANDLGEMLVKRFGCTPKRKAKVGTRGYIGIVLGVTQNDPDPEECVTPREAGNGLDYSYVSSLGVTEGDTENHHNTHRSGEMEKGENWRHPASPRHPSSPPAASGVTDMSGTYSQRVDRYMAHGMGYMEACAKVTEENKARLAA